MLHLDELTRDNLIDVLAAQLLIKSQSTDEGTTIPAQEQKGEQSWAHAESSSLQHKVIPLIDYTEITSGVAFHPAS